MEGYVPLRLQSPFTEVLGRVYEREGAGRRSFAVQIERRHVNVRGNAHGGFLATFADVVLCKGPALRPHVPRITVTLSCNYIGVAHEGEWLEADVDVKEEGRSLVFANANLHVAGRAVAHASAVLRIPKARVADCNDADE
jgi:acyl-coenzyme A thioesterase PaaI-like protein